MKISGKLGILIIICITFSFILIGCHGDTPQPIADQLPREELQVVPTASHEPYPIFIKPTETSSPEYPSPDTATIILNSATSTVTEFPQDVIFIEKLTCATSGDYAWCEDRTLGLEFEYPYEWGEIEAILRRGDTGQEYLYHYSLIGATDIYGHRAGGLSRDFSEGRGGSYTSFKGFGVRNGCQYYESAFLCEEISQEVVLVFYYPTADSICRPFDNPVFSPIALIAIDLPENPFVNGFVFAVPFLSEEFEAEIQRQANTILGDGISNCDPTTEAEFDVWINELIASIQDGTADEVTISNLEKIYHLFYSIKFK